MERPFRRHRIACACAFALALALPACGSGAALPSLDDGTSSEASGAALTLPDHVTVPEVAHSGGPTTIDTSGVAEGWVGARAQSDSRLKFQVSCGEMTYNYDLPGDGSALRAPINMGDGDYDFRIMENIEGNTYAELASAHAHVTLDSEVSPYLVPTVFCDYDAASACVAKARELLAETDNQGAAVRDICLFVAQNVSYDYDKAKRLSGTSGYVPNADETLSTGRGICFDYACLTAAMLRSAGLPAQVVTGYVSPDNLYHAWVMVNVDGSWRYAQFSVSPNTWSRCDVTFASTGGGETVGDGASYTDQYVY